MRFKFKDRKTAQAAAFLAQLNGGAMNYMVLGKLLYLADRQMLLEHHAPLTGDRMFAMKHGPVLSRVYDLITDGAEPGEKSAWSEYFDAPVNYEVKLKRKLEEFDSEELSRFETKLLTALFEQYGKMDKWALVDLLHKTLPEWKDPGSSCFEIEPEAIFRAESRPEEDIQRAKSVAQDLWFFDSRA